MTGRCPECGTPAEQSRVGDVLRFSSHAYRRRVARGFSVVLWAWSVELLNQIPDLLIPRERWAAVATVETVTGAATLAGMWGWWMATAPDPSQLGIHRADKTRLVARIVLLLYAPVAVFDSVLGWMTAESLWTGLATVCAALAFFVTSCVYLGWLAARVPAPGLARRCRFATVAIPLAVLPVVLVAMILADLVAGGGLPLDTILVTPPIGVAIVWYLALIWQVRTGIARLERSLTAASEPRATPSPSRGSSEA